MRDSVLDFIKNYIKKHPAIYTFILYIFYPILLGGKSHKALLDIVPANEVVLNLGAGPTEISDRAINVDIAPYKNVDVIADVHNLPFKADSVGGVISVAMLEHVEQPQKVVAEMHRVLKPGGHIYTLVPFIFGYHSAPSDYFRWTKEGVRVLFRAFSEVETGVRSGPTSSMLIILAEWLAMLLSFHSRLIYQILYVIFMIVLSPIKILDFYLNRHPEAEKTAATFYYIGKKNQP
jgi:SAM-dependent methyltransferase